jgi:hypothetical protein
MERRLDGITERTQALGGPVPSDEIATRWQLAYKRLKRIPFTPEEEAWWKGQGGGERLPTNLAKHAKRELFSSRGAFPTRKGGASFMEGLAEKAKGLADPGANPSAVLGALGKGVPGAEGLMGALGKGVPGAEGLMGALGKGGPGAAGLMGALAPGGLPAKPPTLESFLASQGVPMVPIKSKKVPGDFLGNGARWWVKAASSPYLGTLVKLTFFFMFFISFLESTPLVGSVMSVALDAVLTGGRILVKVLQKGVPMAIGLIPLPYTQLVGVILVSIVGMFVWTILAVISFGRQDFTSAIDSMLRILPMPIGDSLGDAFLDLNRTADRFNDKRIQLTEDIWNGLLLVQQMLTQAVSVASSSTTGALARVQSGADTLLDAVRGIREPAAPTATPVAPGTPVPPAVPTATPVAPGAPAAVPEPAPAPPAPAPVAPVVPAPAPAPAPVAPVVPAPAPVAPVVPAPAPAPAPVAPVVPAPAPVAPVVPAPVAPVAPVVPAPVAPVAPVPVAAPAPVAPVPVAAPAPAPAPLGPPPPQMSALERLRSGQSVNKDLNVGRGIRGGKTLSAKRQNQRKWTSRQSLYERFSGAGLR